MSSTRGNEDVIKLLLTLRNTAIPKSVDSGEAITYSALRDTVLDNAISILGPTKPIDSAIAKTELCVDHRKLANTVLERTFDVHTQLLRQKLKEAEEEAEMWRKVALFGSHGTPKNASLHLSALSPAMKVEQRCDSTQTAPENTTPSADLNQAVTFVGNQITALQELFAGKTDGVLMLLDTKVELLCSANINGIDEHRYPLETERPSLDTDIVAGPDSYNRSSPGSSIIIPRLPSAKQSFKAKTRKAVSVPVFPVTSPLVKSAAGREAVTAFSPAKPTEPVVSTHGDSVVSNPAAQAVDTGNSTDPLYVLRALHLKPRNSVSPRDATSLPRNKKQRQASQLPQL
jgi:hypothetical protein